MQSVFLVSQHSWPQLYGQICFASIFSNNPFSSVQFSSVAQLCPTLCHPRNHSTPGLPAHYKLPEFTQTHAHRVDDAIQPSHPLSSPSPSAPNLSQHQGLFQWVNSSHGDLGFTILFDLANGQETIWYWDLESTCISGFALCCHVNKPWLTFRITRGCSDPIAPVTLSVSIPVNMSV